MKIMIGICLLTGSRSFLGDLGRCYFGVEQHDSKSIPVVVAKFSPSAFVGWERESMLKKKIEREKKKN